MINSVCLLIKNENKYLEEWVRWHLNQGFNYFYIYNTGEENPADIMNMINCDFTLINWHDKYKYNMQLEAYRDCLSRATCNNDAWVAFIDSDEFIYLPQNWSNTIEEEVTVIQLKQIMFNANGALLYNNKPVQERFTKTCDNLEHFRDVKSIVRPNKIDYMGIHSPVRFSGKILKMGVYNHYYTKSLEEWTEKIQRGSSDPRVRKKYSSFFLYNPDLQEYDTHKNVIQGYASNIAKETLSDWEEGIMNNFNPVFTPLDREQVQELLKKKSEKLQKIFQKFNIKTTPSIVKQDDKK